jgi:hypothetical protein
MSRQIKTYAFAVTQLDIIGLPSVCYTRQQARKEAIASERIYMTAAENKRLDDRQVWKRMYRHGFRVTPVVILHDSKTQG